MVEAFGCPPMFRGGPCHVQEHLVQLLCLLSLAPACFDMVLHGRRDKVEKQAMQTRSTWRWEPRSQPRSHMNVTCCPLRSL
eukprot:1312076-Amphidinium_carterae.2